MIGVASRASVITAPMKYPISVRRWLRPGGRRCNRRTPGLYARKEPIVATNKPELRIVGEADTGRARKSEPPITLFQRALRGATNDEALEIGILLVENLAERAENAADMAIDSDQRDVENEALVFIQEAENYVHVWARGGRRGKAWHKLDDAQKDLQKAIRNRRSRLDGQWSSLEQFSQRRSARVQSAYAVEAARETRQRDELIERADLTPERVLAAMQRAVETCGHEVKAKDVTIALLPELADTSIVGRQTVVNRVSQIMRRLVGEGTLVQHRNGDNNGGRNTCSYGIASDA